MIAYGVLHFNSSQAKTQEYHVSFSDSSCFRTPTFDTLRDGSIFDGGSSRQLCNKMIPTEKKNVRCGLVSRVPFSFRPRCGTRCAIDEALLGSRTRVPKHSPPFITCSRNYWFPYSFFLSSIRFLVTSPVL